MLHRGFAACALLLVVQVGRGAEPLLPDLPIESYRLANGLKVVLHRDASVPRVSVCVAYHVGSKDERAGKTGFAHFFEHMMFRGTKNVPNFDVPLQETGGQSNAFTTEDVTVYHETVPSSYLDRALFLEAERLAFLPSALEQAKFDTEREVVKNERRQSVEGVPYGLADETLLNAIFPTGHPYSWSVIGSMKDLDAASLKDLRRFFLEYYHPGNACLCLAGDFDPAAARGLIARYFGPLRAGETPPRPRPAATPAVSVEASQSDEVTLPRIYWAWPTVADDDPDAAALGLLGIVLSGGDASRLERSLVVEGRVAKDVSAESDTREIGGYFQIRATAAEGKSVAEVEAAVGREVDRLKAEPPTAEELTRALAQFEKSNYSNLTSPLNRAFALSLGYLQHDDPTHYRAEIARTFRVTPADLARVAAKYLVPTKVVLKVLPRGSTVPKAAASQAGPAPSSLAAREVSERLPETGPDWTALPGPSPAAEFSAPRPIRKTLGNGVQVWIIPWKTLPIVAGALIQDVGTADDPPGKTGLADLSATLHTKGTKERTATELAAALETLGVGYQCSAENDTTSLRFNVLARNLEPALKLLTPMFAEPRLDPVDFDREREMQLASIRQGPDRITWLASRAFRSLLYGPDHPYGRPADGSLETVRAINLGDVRAFHASRFAANRAKLLVAGDVDPDALMPLLEATIGRWRSVGPAGAIRPPATALPEPGVVHLVDKPGAPQSVLRIGRRWVDRKDPREYPAAIGNHVFGVDFLSRLNKNLREDHGYSYGAGSTFSYRRGGSVWLANSSVRGDATAAALKEMIAEFDAAAGAKPLTPEEIALGRDALGRSFPESFEDPEGILGVLQMVAVSDLPADYLATYLAKIRETTDAQVTATFAGLLRAADRTILVVGDRKAVEPQLRAAGFDKIRLIDAGGRELPRR